MSKEQADGLITADQMVRIITIATQARRDTERTAEAYPMPAVEKAERLAAISVQAAADIIAVLGEGG